MTSPNPLPITSMDEARLLKLMAEREAALAKVSEIDGKLSSLCRRYSRDNGYKVHLSPEQMKRAIEAGRAV